MAPEMIQGLNQSFGVDWWALGILIFEMMFGHTPFCNDRNGAIKMYEKVLTLPIEFYDPKSQFNSNKYHKSLKNGRGITTDCHSIILLLLRKTPRQRLGSGPFGILDVKSHPWFVNYDWDSMHRQTLEAPYVPAIRDKKDLSNIDNSFAFDDFQDNRDNNNDNFQNWDENSHLFDWCRDF